MIPVDLGPPPPKFDRHVRDKGDAWLKKNPDKPASKLKDYWNWPACRTHLLNAFRGRCAYLGLYTPDGQVDHFVAKSVDRTRAYDWSNFRWGNSRVNLLKGGKAFVDPCGMGQGWIEINPASLEFTIGPNLPIDQRQMAENTVAVLNDPELVAARRWYVEPFCLNGEWDLARLDLAFPLLAQAVRAVLTPPSPP